MSLQRGLTVVLVSFNSQAHVHETNKRENLSGYMKTIPCSPPPGGYGVYALDCEMVGLL